MRHCRDLGLEGHDFFGELAVVVLDNLFEDRETVSHFPRINATLSSGVFNLFLPCCASLRIASMGAIEFAELFAKKPDLALPPLISHGQPAANEHSDQ